MNLLRALTEMAKFNFPIKNPFIRAAQRLMRRARAPLMKVFCRRPAREGETQPQ